MRQLLRFLCLATIAVLLSLPISGFAAERHWLQIVGDNGVNLGANARCNVRTAAANTEPTIYDSLTLGTSKTNPITTDSNGICDWFVADNTTVDVLVFVDAGLYQGTRVRVDAVTATGDHRVVISRSSSLKVSGVRYAQTQTDTSTSYSLPAGALITEVINEVITHSLRPNAGGGGVGSSGGVDLQVAGGSANGLCNHSAADAVGFVNCAPTDVLLASSAALQYNTNGHNISGWGYVYWLETANSP